MNIIVKWFVNRKLNDLTKEGTMFGKILEFLSGKKAYIIAVGNALVAIGGALAEHQSGKPIEWMRLWDMLAASGVIAAIRAAITKTSK